MDEIILPPPHPAFEWQATAYGPALVCRPLLPHARHLFTTRPWALGSRQRHLDEAEPWQEVAAAVDVPIDRLVRMRQVHGADAIEALPGAPLQQADIAISDNPELALAVQAADCVPLLLVDVQTGAAAAAHAGWRGLAMRVPACAIDALVRTFGSRPEHLMAAAGPSIAACCYEVGDDVRAAFGARHQQCFSERRGQSGVNRALPALPESARQGHWYFDGWQCLRDQLKEYGVPHDRIFLPELCTASHAALFCSYRRDGTKAGRLAAVIRPSRRPWPD